MALVEDLLKEEPAMSDDPASLRQRVDELQKEVATLRGFRQQRTVRRRSEAEFLGLPLWEIAIGPDAEKGEWRAMPGSHRHRRYRDRLAGHRGIRPGIVALGGCALGAISLEASPWDSSGRSAPGDRNDRRRWSGDRVGGPRRWCGGLRGDRRRRDWPLRCRRRRCRRFHPLSTASGPGSPAILSTVAPIPQSWLPWLRG